MKDHRSDIESLLLAARPHPQANSVFTQTVMQQIGQQKAVKHTLHISRNQGVTNVFARFATTHRTIAVLLLLMFVAITSFSGYAYATGSNPISLLRRWVSSDGKTVNVEYTGRIYQYNSKRTYSDAAVTAFAELTTIDDLYFKASNVFQVPTNGVEHISNPSNPAYIYPWFGTVEKYDANTLYIRKQFVSGDKVSNPLDTNELVSMPIATASLFREGERESDPSKIVGKLVEVYADNFLEHRVGSPESPVDIQEHFVFSLTHTLDQVKEAKQADRPAKPNDSDKNGIMPYGPTWDITNICLNNGADRCDMDKIGRGSGDSLYSQDQPGASFAPQQSQPISTNKNVIPYGEAVIDPSQQPRGVFMRSVEGTITEITPAHIVLRSSSGILWSLSYTAEQQQSFASRYRPLKIGDRIGASILGEVNAMDNHQIDDRHIYSAQRY